MEFEAQLKCGSCGVYGFGMLDLLRHKQQCEDRICVICMDRHASTILEPCLHNRFCSECIQKVLTTSRKCPYCRAAVLHVHGTLTFSQQLIMDEAAQMATSNGAVLDQEGA